MANTDTDTDPGTDLGTEYVAKHLANPFTEGARRQRRYELARDLARGFASGGQGWASIPEVLAKTAVETADALLDLLAHPVRDNEPEPGAQ